MPAQVGGDDAPSLQALLGKPAEALAVRRDPVQADQRRPGGVAVLVDVQAHGREPTAREKD